MLDGSRACGTRRTTSGHEILIERPNGERLTALAHVSPILDDSGVLLGAVNVVVDVTDRRRAEDALKAANRAKDEFLATLAHELRNPLAPIRNAARILQLDESPSPNLRWALDVIDRQMQQMTRLIDDLLDISRITVNKLELRKLPVDVSEIVRAAVESSQPLLESCGHELRVTVEPQLFVDGDLTRLAQVVSNLLNNAAKYMERGGQIWLTAERQGGEAVISVRDTGIGIPAEMLTQVFEIFVQVDRSLSRSRGGLGIGLTLVKRIVEMHDGTVTAKSEGSGKGSEFVVRLPARAAEATTAGARDLHPTRRPFNQPDSGRRRQRGFGGEPRDAARDGRARGPDGARRDAGAGRRARTFARTSCSSTSACPA